MRTQIISHCFEINPVPAARPRVSRFSTYYPKKYTRFKKEMEALTSELDSTPCENLVCVSLKFKIKIPQSWSKKKRLERENTYCNNNSDIDNYVKAMLDSLNGVYFIDDRQVVEVFASKKYSNEPRILFKMMEMNNDERGDV
jgi:Holliday junction resolvase RusA-like endonuclease